MTPGQCALALTALHTRYLGDVERLLPEFDAELPDWRVTGRVNHPAIVTAWKWKTILEEVESLGDWSVGWFEAVYRRLERYLTLSLPPDGRSAGLPAASGTPPEPSTLSGSGVGEPQRAEKEEPKPEGEYAKLMKAAETLELKGNELKIVNALCANKGKVSLADLALLCNWGAKANDGNDGKWSPAFDSSWNSARDRLNKKLKRHCWRLKRHDNHAWAKQIPIATSARK